MSDNEKQESPEKLLAAQVDQKDGEKPGRAQEGPAPAEETPAPGRAAEGAPAEAGDAAGSGRRVRMSRRPELRRLRHGLRAVGRSRRRPAEEADSKPKGSAQPGVREEPQTGQAPANDARTRSAASVKELLGDNLRERARCADPKLRAQLMGSLLIKFVNSSESFLFDWSSEELSMGFNAAQSVTPECIIAINEQNLLRIASGDLNPQIAMLSDKIKVQGKLSLAIYWFNLIAPRSGDRAHDGY